MNRGGPMPIRPLAYFDIRHWTFGVSMRFGMYRWYTGYQVPFSFGWAIGPFCGWFDFAEKYEDLAEEAESE